MMKIGVVGLGYVGYSISLLYSRKNQVFAVDIDDDKVKKLNQRIPLLRDSEAEKILEENELNLSCSTDINHLSECTAIFICLPTNFNSKNNTFDTNVIKKTLKVLMEVSGKQAFFIIKSTVPIGFTKEMNKSFNTNRIVFSPEFLREGSAINDNFYPDRIIVGSDKKFHYQLLDLMESIVIKDKVALFGMNSCEAESVKLLSNSYLAMRVAFFNELDSLSLELKLNSKSIIDGMSADNRIGNFYNNPSFGYGGYCLPKDTRQLQSQAMKISHHSIFSSIINSNFDRLNFIAEKIINKNPNVIGIYGLAMKKGSDNFRESSVLKIIELIRSKSKINIIAYDPDNFGLNISDIRLETNFSEFIKSSEIILANRMDAQISKHKDKIFTRDIYARD